MKNLLPAMRFVGLRKTPRRGVLPAPVANEARMARLVSVICTSHTPFMLSSVDRWEHTRTLRAGKGGFDPGVPVESRAEMEAKDARIAAARGVLRDALRAAAPDVLVVFGDDQLEQFKLTNFPALGIFTGDAFSGFKISPLDGPPFPGDWPPRPRTAEHWATVPGKPDLAKFLLTRLLARGFDLAFSTQLGDADRGMGHAIMRAHTLLETGFGIPTVPVWINCYYGPQPTAQRCYDFGRAVRATIEDFPDDLRVAVIGSGGLWHTPGAGASILDETFDRAILAEVASGDARAMAAAFDAYRLVYDPADARSVKDASGGTGIVTGLGSGTGETRNWIAAAATVDGVAGTVVDYIPVYASPVGIAFASWSLDGSPK